MKPGCRKVSEGFTLIELLVVIAVIAVLAGMILPALSNARDRAKTTFCLNNMRQWGIALHVNSADNSDVIPRDGTDDGGNYSPDNNQTVGQGTPNDPNAWFNVLPFLVGDKSLSTYFADTKPPKDKFPFPGNNVGRLWMCPSIKVSTKDNFLKGGQYGFFGYAMNLDLKLLSDIGKNKVVGNSYLYPAMPKLSQVKRYSSVVFLTEAAFSPTIENFDPTPNRNAIYPAVRWSYFPVRHAGRGTIVFLDGHSAGFKRDYVFNPNPTPDSREEKMNPDVWWNPNRDKDTP